MMNNMKAPLYRQGLYRRRQTDKHTNIQTNIRTNIQTNQHTQETFIIQAPTIRFFLSLAQTHQTIWSASRPRLG